MAVFTVYSHSVMYSQNVLQTWMHGLSKVKSLPRTRPRSPPALDRKPVQICPAPKRGHVTPHMYSLGRRAKMQYRRLGSEIAASCAVIRGICAERGQGGKLFEGSEEG